MPLLAALGALMQFEMIEARTRNTAETVADGIAYCEEATTAIFHAALD